MWGRFWNQIYPMVVPYPDRPSVDVTDTMVKQVMSFSHWRMETPPPPTSPLVCAH